MLNQILPQIYPLNDYHVIIAHGKFPESPYLRQLIHSAKTIICCDGAMHNLLKHTIYPDHIIGDCDSLSKEIQQYFKSKIITIADQNTNDLTKAVTFANETLKLKNIIILGATGLREDHSIANIGLLSQYIQLIDRIALISDYGIFTAHSNNICLNTVKGQQISFFTMNSNTKISCLELKWPLTDFQIDRWHQGTLNQAIDTQINLQLNGGTVIVFRAFEVK